MKIISHIKNSIKLLAVFACISCYYVNNHYETKIMGKWKGVGTITTSRGITKDPEPALIVFEKSGRAIEGDWVDHQRKAIYKIKGDTIFWYNTDGSYTNIRSHIDTLTETRLAYKFSYQRFCVDYHFARVK